MGGTDGPTPVKNGPYTRAREQGNGDDRRIGPIVPVYRQEVRG